MGVKKGPKAGARIIEGLEEALAWSKGENVAVRVTHKVGSRISNIRRSGPNVAASSNSPRNSVSQLQHLETESAPTRVPLAVIANLGFKSDAARRRFFMARHVAVLSKENSDLRSGLSPTG